MTRAPRIYRGALEAQPYRPGVTIVAHTVTVNDAPLPMSALAAQLAPTGFGWGSNGLSAQALAHSLLAYEFDEQVATAYYRRFARQVVAAWPEQWRITGDELYAWLVAAGQTRRRRRAES